MKRTLGKWARALFFGIGKAFSLLAYLKLYKLVVTVRNWFYSGFLSSSFKKCGVGLFTDYPLHIIGNKFISIGNNTGIYSGTRIEVYDNISGQIFTPELIVGDNVNIIYDCHIGCVDKITIGDNVLIASKVFITDHFHGDGSVNDMKLAPSLRKIYAKGPVVIGNNVWIGEGVAIMPNVTIGENTIVGANSVVTKSFPANSVIGGVPARLLK